MPSKNIYEGLVIRSKDPTAAYAKPEGGFIVPVRSNQLVGKRFKNLTAHDVQLWDEKDHEWFNKHVKGHIL